MIVKRNETICKKLNRPKYLNLLEILKRVVPKTVCKKLQETTKELDFVNFETISSNNTLKYSEQLLLLQKCDILCLLERILCESLSNFFSNLAHKD